MSDGTLLEVEGLRKTYLRTRGLARRVIGEVKAVDGVSFSVDRGATLALVGESGCGKTTTGRCVLRAVEPTAGAIHVHLDGTAERVNMAELAPEQLKTVRKNMAMIFQDPFSSLNPRMPILEIVGESYIIHRLVNSRRELEERVAALLAMVKLDAGLMRRYPHAFSGGQRQRIAIARALALEPQFIVADEPVSALDVSVQAQVLNLLRELQARLQLTYLFVAHNLAVVEYVSSRVAVMYLGKIVELAETRPLFDTPRHPYTEALLSAVPKADPRAKRERIILQGEVPDPAHPPSGCTFHTRCPYAQPICREREPPLVPVASGGQSPHYASCHFAEELQLIGVKKT